MQRCVLFLCFAAMLTASGPASAKQTPAERRLAGQVATLIDRYPVVGIGESHRHEKLHKLLLDVIGDPRVFCRIDDIVVEFGNARLQPIADRYIAGGRVSPADKRSMWRETGQWLVWDSPVYEQFFDSVRAANARRMCRNHKVRVLLGDPPIDWSKVRTAADYKPFADRVASYAEVIDREVLAKKHRALLIIGTTHLMRAQPREFTGGLTEAQFIDHHHPGAMFSILTVGTAVAAKLGLAPAPSLLMTAAGPVGRRSYAALVPESLRMQVTVNGKREWKPASELHWPAIRQVADGLLNVGDPGPELLPDPAIYRDPVYQAELRRRAAILEKFYGFEFLPDLEAELARGEPPAAGK